MEASIYWFLNSIIYSNTYISNRQYVNHTQHLKSGNFRGLLQMIKKHCQVEDQEKYFWTSFSKYKKI